MPERSSVDWAGLLRWSLAYTGEAEAATGGEASATGGEAAVPRSAEDLEFLQQAMTEFMSQQPDVDAMVAEAAEILKEPAAPAHELLSAIAVIVEGADLQPELARYLDKFEGLVPHLQAALAHSDLTVREKVAECLALVLPNNPSLQTRFYEQGLLSQLLVEMTAKRAYALCADESQNRYFTKLMSVLSALVKNCPPAERDFLENGRSFIDALLPTPYARLRVKLDSMLDHLDAIAPPPPLSIAN